MAMRGTNVHARVRREGQGGVDSLARIGNITIVIRRTGTKRRGLNKVNGMCGELSSTATTIDILLIIASQPNGS